MSTHKEDGNLQIQRYNLKGDEEDSKQEDGIFLHRQQRDIFKGPRVVERCETSVREETHSSFTEERGSGIPGEVEAAQYSIQPVQESLSRGPGHREAGTKTVQGKTEKK